jgi:hypothetical protein
VELYERVLHRLLVAIACFVVFVSTLARPLAPLCAMHSASKMLYQAISDTAVSIPLITQLVSCRVYVSNIS